MAYFEHTVFESLWRAVWRWMSAPFCSRRKQILQQRARLRAMSDEELRQIGLTRDDLRDDIFRKP